MRYFISDLHFFHSALNTRMDNRGFDSVEAMNEHMIDRWNSRVRNKKDEVVILGDFSLSYVASETNCLLNCVQKLDLYPVSDYKDDLKVVDELKEII